MASLIGQSLGRYHILEQLGEGGMATVYKAYDTRLETDVAVKVIRTEKLTEETKEHSLKRFEREAKALARLTHPNIVKVTDYGEYEGKPYLVMPYLPGGTLKEKLAQPISWQEAIQILLPIAEALDYAHSQNMIHRDVKPSNILLTQRGQPMLTDFGIAKILDLNETLDITGAGTAIGTPEYMAPEQATAKTVDLRADIYSLGIVLYEMVTGRRPFTADTPMAILIKHATEPLPRPRQFVANLPDGVEKVLFKALAKQPGNRYQSMGDFADALRGLLDGKQTKKTLPQFIPPAVEEGVTIEENPIIEPPTRIDLKTLFRKINTNTFWIIGLIVLIGLVVTATIGSRQTGAQPVIEIQPAAESLPLVFTGNSGNEINIYLYDSKNNVALPKVVGGGKNWDPVISVSGNIYFTSNRDGKAEIYRLVNGKIERVTNTPGQSESWGPVLGATGNIYFTSNQQDNKAEIYRLVNKNIERVTYSPGESESWGSALGTTGNIYFTSNQQDNKAEIYRLVNKNIERVTYTPGESESWGPALGTTGNIYFTSNQQDNKAEIYRLVNGNFQRVTYTPGRFQSWGVILRGSKIYYTSDSSNRREVYLLASPQINISNMEAWTGIWNERSPGY